MTQKREKEFINPLIRYIMNTFCQARKQARFDGVKITDKQDLSGYKISCQWDGNYMVELVFWNEEKGLWESYDYGFDFPTMHAARLSAKGHC